MRYFKIIVTEEQAILISEACKGQISEEINRALKEGLIENYDPPIVRECWIYDEK
jgi:hypothetical protein